MRKIIIVDKNKELIEAVRAEIKQNGKGVFDEVEVIHGDVIKVHEKTPNSKIVTASNPDFSPDGGLDALLAKKYDFNGEEFSWDDHLFYAVSVDKNRQSSKDILLRLAVGVLGYSHTFVPILTGVGTGIGGASIQVFCEVLRAILSNLRSANLGSADLRFANLRSANLGSADLRFANLRFANLRSANLGSADLRFANLMFANLGSANLRSADLRSANLRSADLGSAKNLAPKYHEPLNILRFQKGKLIAYKFVKDDLSSPINGNILYKVGKIITEKDFEPDDRIECGRGINVADLSWCVRGGSQTFVEVEFSARDIVSIPYNTDGKFRVKKCKVLRSFDLKEANKMLEKRSNLK